VPKIIDPVFAKTSLKCSFCMTENERFGFVFTKTGSINSGTGQNTVYEERLQCVSIVDLAENTKNDGDGSFA
jgi:hypothetical protein